MVDDKRLSKFLALVLRHRPDEFDIILDADGFTDADALFAVIQGKYGSSVTYDDFVRVVTSAAQDGKQRYELQHGRVRARYGHNKRVTAVQYEPVTPPEVLYHGAPSHVIKQIRKDGLIPMERQYVHLTTTVERATSVATRHGTPVLLRVDTVAAMAGGVVFYQADAEHYLTLAVPAAFITFPD